MFMRAEQQKQAPLHRRQGQNGRAFALRWATAVLCLCASLGQAHAQASNIASSAPPNSAHEAARQALAAQKYELVIAAYDGYTDLSAIGFYRSSIAQARLNEPVKAFNLLQKALAVDAAGRFASSPQRLESFLDNVLQACAAQDLPGCIEEPVAVKPHALPSPAGAPRTDVISSQTMPASSLPNAQTPLSLTSTEPPLSSIEPAPLSTQATQTTTSSAAGVDAPASSVPFTAPTPYVPPSNEASAQAPTSMPSTQNTLVMAAIAMILTALATAAITRWAVRRQQKAAELPPLDALHASVMRQLKVAGPDTKLHAVLKGIVPLLEQEAGRAHFLKVKDPSLLKADDLWQIQVSARYEKKPMSMANATQDEVKALFQAQRWS